MKPVVYAAVGGSYSDYRVYAIFSTEAAARAFIEHPDSSADDIEVRELFDAMPSCSKWYVIERTTLSGVMGEVQRHEHVTWDFDGPMYVGHKRDSWNYSKWAYGERAFGKNKAAVEQAWADAQAAEPR